MEEKDIIDEFLEENHEHFELVFEVGGFRQCPICGIRPEKMMLLSEAVRKLRDKNNV